MKYSTNNYIQEHFRRFEMAISLSKAKERQLRNSKKAVEKRIKEHFKAQYKLPVPSFFIQGSYKMKTMVIKKDGTYDVDLGVYFRRDAALEPATLQKHVHKAVKMQTSRGAQRKDKCVRIIYQGDYNIDLPIYSTDDEEKRSYLATKKGWFESDPKELCRWFEGKYKEHGSQLISLVKYFKAWAGNISSRMPAGIAFTVWVAEYFIPHKRDDVAFFKTAQAIQDSFGRRRATCENPAIPYDNFLDKMTYNQINSFEDKFEKMIETTGGILSEKDSKKVLKHWRRLFGERFPLYVN